MKLDQRKPDTAGTWQDALSPRLVNRLARPLTRPGVIAPGLGRAIIARMQHTGAHMPLLDLALRRLHSVEDARATRSPIVYARPSPPTAQPAASDAEARPLPTTNAAPAAVHPVVRPTLAATTSPPPGASPPLALPVVRAHMRATEPPASGPALQRSASTVAAHPSPLPPQAVSPVVPEAPASPPSDYAPPLVLGAQGPGREGGPRQAPADAAPAVPPPPPAAAPALPSVLPLHAAPAPSPPGARPAAAASDEPVRIVLPPGRRIQRGEAAAPPGPPRPPAGEGTDRIVRAGAESALTAAVPPAIQRMPHDPGPPDTHTTAAQPGAVPPERLPLARPQLAATPASPATPVAPRPPLDAVTPLRPIPLGAPATSQPASTALPLPPVATVQRHVITPAVGSPWSAAAETAPAGPVVTPLRRVERAEQAPLTMRGADAAKVQAAPATPTLQRPSAAPVLQAASGAALAGPSADLPAADAASQPAGPDVNQIAAQVYELLVRRIASERERRGR